MAEVHAIYRHHVLHSAASFDEKPPSVGELTRRRADILGHGLPITAWAAAGLALLSFPPSSIVAKQAPGVR
jgi:L-amino acid N-acyltransferase YncA